MSQLIRPLRESFRLSNSLSKPFVISSRNMMGTHNPTRSVKYGGKYRIALVHGDGIGPEMMDHIKRTSQHVRAPIDFEEIELNSKNVTPELVNQAVLAIKRNGVAIKGNLKTNHNSFEAISVNIELRKRLELFANVLRCKNIPGLSTRHSDIDILVIRENTEGEYSNLEHESVPGVVESLKIITRERSMRIAEFAFERAHLYGRKKVTAVHKANIMKLGDGLFLECCRKVARNYPNIEFESMIVDNTCMQLVSKPHQFDVMVMPNLYGNIVANVCSGLVGGAGLVAGANFGEECAIFEKGTRNSVKSLAHQNVANPAGMLFTFGNMLTYIGLPVYGKTVKKAVINTISEHKVRTFDIGGQATTTDFMAKVFDEIDIIFPRIKQQQIEKLSSA